MLVKPRHIYETGFPKESLSSNYKSLMRTIDYADLAEHPEKLPEPKQYSQATDYLDNASSYFTRIHYYTVMKMYGVKGIRTDLDALIRESRSFLDVMEKYNKEPERYGKGVGDHLAEVYDAVKIDMECTPVANTYMEQMLTRYAIPSLSEDTKQKLEGLQNADPRSVWIRSKEEQQEFLKQRLLVKKTAAADTAGKTAGVAGAKERWDAVLGRKPGLSAQEKEEIRKMYQEKKNRNLKLALRYTNELKKISTDELKEYSQEEYHGVNHELHMYNGKLAFDADKMLEDLKISEDIRNYIRDIKEYTHALAANSRQMQQEDNLLLNPLTEYIKYENVQNAEQLDQASGQLGTLGRKDTSWKTNMQILTTGLMHDRETGRRNAEFRTDEKRKKFEEALDKVAAAIGREISRTEEIQPEETAEKKAAPKRKLPANSLQEKGLAAGKQTDAYLRHAGDLLNAEPAAEEKYAAFCKAMKELTDYTVLLSTPDKEQKLPAVDAGVLNKLQNCYQKAQKAGYDLLIAAGRGQKNAGSISRTVQIILNLLQKDRNVFEGYDPERKLTFPQMVSAARSEYIDAENVKDQIRHGGMNQRMAMNVKLQEEDGKARYAKGMFTAEESFDAAKFVNDVRKKYHLTNQQPKKRLTDQDRVVKAVLDALARVDEVENEDKLVRYLNNMVPLGTNGVTVRYRWKNDPGTPESSEFMQGINLLNEKLGYFEMFRRDFCLAKRKALTLESAGIPPKSRLDQRSSAMSAVAKLLGRESLIVKSRPMMMKKNGKLVKGTFMEFSELTDLDVNPEKFIELDHKAVNNAGYVKDTADLQILDFICGNADRHNKNLFYRLENNQITGVQGIDNDLSFGLLDDEVLKGDDHMVCFKGLKKMKIITKEMAETIQDLTPDMLKTVLSPYGFSKKEIQAACHRLQLVQKAIDPKFAGMDLGSFENQLVQESRHHGTVFQPYRLAVLNQEQIGILAGKADKVLMERLPDQEVLAAENHFTLALDTIDGAKNVKKENEKKKDNGKDHPLPEVVLASREPAMFSAGILADTLSDHIAALEEKNSGLFISSQEYKNVLDYARLMAQQMETIRTNPVNAATMKRAVNMMENLTYLTQVYLDKKTADNSLNSRTAGERYEAVSALQDTLGTCLDRMGLSVNGDFCRLSAVQRAGGFDNHADTKRIAQYIKEMGGRVNQDQFFYDDYLIGKLFTNVSEKSYRRTFKEYQSVLQHVANSLHYQTQNIMVEPVEGKAQDLIDQTLEKLKNLPRDHEGMDQLRHRMKEMKNALTGDDGNSGILEDMRKIRMTEKTGKMFLDLQELANLAAQAEESQALPLSSFKQKIAERLARRDLLQNLSVLNHINGYQDTYRNYLEGPVMQAMTAGKSAAQLKKYAEEPNEELLKRWQKADQKVRRSRQAPAVHHGEEIHI